MKLIFFDLSQSAVINMSNADLCLSIMKIITTSASDNRTFFFPRYLRILNFSTAPRSFQGDNETNKTLLGTR